MPHRPSGTTPLEVRDRVPSLRWNADKQCDEVVVDRRAPGWAWLAGVVVVSLGLWAVLIWTIVRVLSWLT